MNPRTKNFLFSGTALALLAYTTSRAILLSMTHDESSTYFNWMDRNLWTCFFSPECWQTANLHWLNSLLMQWSAGLFGVSEWSLRLPNLLAHVTYLWFSYKLVSSFKTSVWKQWAVFLLLNLHPYMLDFFSLARGYGLAVGFTMLSLYFFWKFFQTQEWKWSAFCFGGAALAVLGNFVFLNYLASLTALYVTAVLFNTLKTKVWTWRTSSVLLAVPLVAILIVATIVGKPIQFLSERGEFEYGIGTLRMTFWVLVQDSLQEQGYLSGFTTIFFAYATMAFLATIGIFAFYYFYKHSNSKLAQFNFAALSMLVLAALGTKVQFHLFGTNFLVHRTALIFVPMALVPIATTFILLEKKWTDMVLGFLTAFAILHFARVANFTHVREWKYDAHTKEMVLYVKSKTAENEVINLGVNWLFYPTTLYYQQTLPVKNIERLNYEKMLRQDTLYDYYYITKEDLSEIHPSYQLEQSFGDNILMKRAE